MRVRFAAIILVASTSSCAYRPMTSKTFAPPPIQAREPASSSSSSSSTPLVDHQVTLPYLFTRRGVEIRVNSIESGDHRVLVNVTLRETRGRTVDLPASTLMRTLTTAGEALAYAGYSLAGKSRTDPAIRLAEHDQFPIALFYGPTPDSADPHQHSFELRFPTGKYWRSETAE